MPLLFCIVLIRMKQQIDQVRLNSHFLKDVPTLSCFPKQSEEVRRSRKRKTLCVRQARMVLVQLDV